MPFSIAIDGPAGAGKSTIAKRIAKQLGFIYIDTGAMYRGMAYYFIKRGIAPEDEAAITKACNEVSISLAYENGEQQVILSGDNITKFLRTEQVGNMTSITCVYLAVRTKLVEIQRQLAAKSDVVMDGRDIGTCVLPQAKVKIYLTATVRTRAVRRYRELIEKNIPCNLEDIEASIIERDTRDMNRELSPLMQAEDAILLDSSEMSIDDVINFIINIYEEKSHKKHASGK